MHKGWSKILLLLLLVVGCAVFLRVTTNQTDRDKGADADGRQYITMAGDTIFPAWHKFQQPFCYRVATPWIASKMPGETYMAKFRLVAFLDAILMMLLCYALLRALGFAYGTSLIGMIFYAGVFWTVKFSFFSPVYIDHMTQVISLLLLWVMAKRWWFLLPPLLFGAFFQKESIIALVPFILFFYLHQKGWKWIPLYLLGFFLLAASVIPFLILRNNIHPNNDASPFTALRDSWAIVSTFPGYSRIMVVAIFSGLGIMPLILLSHFRWLLGYLKQHPYWIVMLLIGVFLLFGGADKGRLMLYMLPGVTVLVVAIVEDFQKRMPVWTFRSWIAIMLILNCYVGCWFTQFVDFELYLELVVPEHSPLHGVVGFSRAFWVLLGFLLVNFILVRPHQQKISAENLS